MPDTGTVDMDFWDFVDIVNPLQHIPVVNTIYRELTGDTIKGVSRVIGGGLYGGVIGLVAGIGSAIIAETTGKDPGEHVLAMLTGSDDETPAPTETPPSRKRRPRHRPRPPTPAAPASPLPHPPSRPRPRSGRQHRHGRARRRRRDPDARRSRRGPGATPAWASRKPRSFPVPKRTAGLLPRPVPMVATGPGGQYRQDAGPARRCPAGGGAGKRETDRIAGAASRRARRGLWTGTGPDGRMAAGRPRQGSPGTGGRHDDERVGQV